MTEYKELKTVIRSYKSILNDLYEDFDEYGDPHEEIPMYEELLKEAEEKLKELENEKIDKNFECS